MKQPINCGPSVLQAAVCDSGVPRKVLALYESRGGGASLWHRVQAETSCGTRDQNPCPTGAVLFHLSWTVIISKLSGIKIVLDSKGLFLCKPFDSLVFFVVVVFIYLIVKVKYYLCRFEQHCLVSHRLSSLKCTMTAFIVPSAMTMMTLRSFRRATPSLPSRHQSYSDRSRSAPSDVVQHPVYFSETTLEIILF